MAILTAFRVLGVFLVGVSVNIAADGVPSDYIASLNWLASSGWFKPSNGADFENWSENRQKLEMRLPLRRMKSFYFGGRQDGELNAEVKDLMSKPKCGVPDISTKHPTIGDQTIGSRFKRYSFLGPRENIWKEFPLTIGYNNYSSQVSRRVQDDLAKSCAAKWAKESGLSFRFVRNRIANIHISFVTLRTRSGAVEGRWGTVGKAISPLPHANPPSSWIRMDMSEVWKPKQTSSHQDRHALSLEEVLCHEIGHTLGLGHSRDRNAIMYPTVGFRTENVRLGTDDIAGIQAHYGRPQETTTKPPKITTTTQRSTTRRTTTTTVRPTTTTRSATTRQTTRRAITTTRPTTTRQTETTTTRPLTTTPIWKKWIPKFNYCDGFPEDQKRFCERARNRNLGL